MVRRVPVLGAIGSLAMNRGDGMPVIERSAMAAVRAYFQRIGLAGPTVAQTEQVIAALREAGMLKRGVKP